jgi:hypothetical protein
MIGNINLKEYLAIPWVKFLFWTIMITATVILIALIANYLTIIVFHIK